MKPLFVGFGFGAIQAGLFLFEAHRTGRFARLVAAEVDRGVVEAVRANGNRYVVNIAHADRLEQAEVEPVELYNPAAADQRELLVEAVSQATEMATALPSVRFYEGVGADSVAAILAEGLARRAEHAPPAIIYAAENHNHAAEHLEEAVRRRDPAAAARAQFVNTVIGKMSGVAQAEEARLAPLAPALPRGFLVEAFNRILISRIHSEGAQRSITVFEEKVDLLPFEEAKLYGHNAIHAMGGYLAAAAGLKSMAELPSRPGILELMRRAFLKDSGAALVRKYNGLDPLFTEAGMRYYAEDLLQRMVNPWLDDAVERITRDPLRKLGWDDRLVGAMRLCMQQGIAPQALAMGVAAAVASIVPAALDTSALAEEWLASQWHDAPAAPDEEARVLASVAGAMHRLREWQNNRFA